MNCFREWMALRISHLYCVVLLIANTPISFGGDQLSLHYARQYNNMPRGNRFQGAPSTRNGTMLAQRSAVRNTTPADIQRHLCPIWIPHEALSKYRFVAIKQRDNAHQLLQIEICCPGFVAVQRRGKTLCRPRCRNCRNGLCMAPDQCHCYDEFVKNDNGDCVFTCPIDCLNGRCHIDGRCQCNIGYKLDETRKFCRPICSRGCSPNSGTNLLNCTEPEVCSCSKGYILTENGCQPLCQPECGLGGECIKPNVCNCLNGYKLKDGICQANCYQKCDNGHCYSQNRCICHPGYAYHERTSMCIPV